MVTATVGEDTFQFTPLREGRRVLPETKRLIFYFNSRPSARGDMQGCGVVKRLHSFQFTPLREGRPSEIRNPQIRNFISIHAPPRGATSR